jgi:hypothetical protein
MHKTSNMNYDLGVTYHDGSSSIGNMKQIGTRGRALQHSKEADKNSGRVGKTIYRPPRIKAVFFG